MKVIDLLNKIANGEEVPKKIKYDKTTYLFRNYDYKEYSIEKDYCDEQTSWIEDKFDFYKINDEVEILEEDKKIEKIDLPNYFEIIPDGHFNTEHIYNQCVKIHDNTILLQNKINEIIDYLKVNK